MAEVRLEGIRKRFGGTLAVDDVSLEVADREFCVVLGPSGCGKSTLLRVVAGLERPDAGRVRIGGRDVTALPPRARDVAFVFQSYALYPHLTVAENLAFPLRVRRVPRAERERRVRAVAELLEIGHLLDRRPAELSGGERQRVAMGRAIVREPAVFLFDEPLSNLDARLRDRMRAELALLHRRLGTTSIYVTHDQVEAMTLGERLVVMRAGRVLQVGTPAEVYARPATPFVAGFLGSPPMNLLEGEVREEAGRARFRAGGLAIDAPPGAPRGAVTLGIRPEELVLGAGPVAAEVELVEELGPDRIVHLRVDGVRLRARAPAREAAPRAGTRVALDFPARALHWFVGERRVEAPAEPVAERAAGRAGERAR